MYTLLIVDDEPLMRRGIKLLADLHTLNIETVLEAGNGEEALSLLNQQQVDLILLDINMPRMDGLTFAEKAKQKWPKVKICMVTGYDYFEYARRALRLGIDEYLLKPVSKKDIELVLHQLIEKLEKSAVHEELNRLDVQPVSEQTFEEQLKATFEAELYKPEMSLSYLADCLGFSSGYLSGIFKEIYGMAFQDYVIKRRMDKAKSYLISTDMKNYEVAEAIGYEDVNYFATRFKKTTGLTPKQYKKKVIHHEK